VSSILEDSHPERELMAESAVVATSTGRLNWLLSASGVAIIGQGLAVSAAPLLAADLSRNPIAVSSVTAATYAAVLLLGLPAGALVDRWPLKRVMVATDLVRFVLLSVFAALVFTGAGSVWLLVGLVFLVGIGNSFFDPAAQAAIPGLVGKDARALARANGKLWALDTFGRGLAGPPLGAAAFAVASALPFGLQSLAFLTSALLLLRVGDPHVSINSDPRRSLLVEIREGVRFVNRQRTIRALTLGTAVFNLAFNIAAAPFVLFAQDRLHLGSLGYGILLALSACGGIAGGWIGARIHERLPALRIIAMALGVQAAGWLLVLVSPNAILAGIGMLLTGIAATTVSVVVGATRQLLTPDGMLGRVVSAARVLGVGAAAIGALLGGILADVTGRIGAPLAVASIVLAVAAFPLALSRRSN
jgi:MFS family permease